MLKLLERSVATLQERLMIVAPADARRVDSFNNVVTNGEARSSLLEELQRLRGTIYLKDGAVQQHQLTADGRHDTAEDERSWHLLLTNKSGEVSSCVWYLDQGFEPSFEQLRARSAPLNHTRIWRERLASAVESELDRARQEGLTYAELGGWAVAETSRCTSEGLLLALGAYSLGRLLGDALGMTTATVRHASSSILRRLGGSPLEANGEAIPSYYDPKYRCVMEMLRFDSRQPSAKYAGLVERMCEKLIDVPVLALTHTCEELIAPPPVADLPLSECSLA